MIKCCKNCVAPKRHSGCHANCKEYIEEKKHDQELKDQYKKNHIIDCYEAEKHKKVSIQKLKKQKRWR